MPCSLLFFSDGTCDSEQMVSSTSYGCPGGPEQSDSSLCSVFPASNILTLDDDDERDVNPWPGQSNYWKAEDGKVGEEQGFIMYLGCIKTVTGVSLKNTHNAHHHDRSTKKFRILGSATNSGPWQELLVADLEDSRNQDPPPLQQLMFENSAAVSFIKFELLGYCGQSGGLQYFAIEGGKSTTSTI